MQATQPQALHAQARPLAPIESTGQRLRKGILLKHIGLFALMLVSEAPVIVVRGLILELATLILSAATGVSIHIPAYTIAIASFAFAALALIFPAGDGWLFRYACRGHKPLPGEREKVGKAIAQLRRLAPQPLTLPADWFVVISNTPAAAVYGETLVLTSSLLDSQLLHAALAHQIAHIERGDGRLTAAIARLTLTPPPMLHLQGHPVRPHRPRGHPIKLIGLIFKYARGGYGISLLNWLRESIVIAAEHSALFDAAKRVKPPPLGAVRVEPSPLCAFLEMHPVPEHRLLPLEDAEVDQRQAEAPSCVAR